MIFSVLVEPLVLTCKMIFVPVGTPPKRGAKNILPPAPSPVPTETDYKTEESQAELRLLDEEIMQDTTENDTNNQTKKKTKPNTLETKEVTASFKCQIVMAILALLALIPLICIVIYLVGMFWKVPSTMTITS